MFTNDGEVNAFTFSAFTHGGIPDVRCQGSHLESVLARFWEICPCAILKSVM